MSSSMKAAVSWFKALFPNQLIWIQFRTAQRWNLWLMPSQPKHMKAWLSMNLMTVLLLNKLPSSYKYPLIVSPPLGLSSRDGLLFRFPLQKWLPPGWRTQSAPMWPHFPLTMHKVVAESTSNLPLLWCETVLIWLYQEPYCREWYSFFSGEWFWLN